VSNQKNNNKTKDRDDVLDFTEKIFDLGPSPKDDQWGHCPKTQNFSCWAEARPFNAHSFLSGPGEGRRVKD